MKRNEWKPLFTRSWPELYITLRHSYTPKETNNSLFFFSLYTLFRPLFCTQHFSELRAAQILNDKRSHCENETRFKKRLDSQQPDMWKCLCFSLLVSAHWRSLSMKDWKQSLLVYTVFVSCFIWYLISDFMSPTVNLQILKKRKHFVRWLALFFGQHVSQLLIKFIWFSLNFILFSEGRRLR